MTFGALLLDANATVPLPPGSVNGSQGEQVTIIIPANLSKILGPYLIGIFLNWGLLGVLSNQVYIYYLCFPNDARYIKTLVYSIYILEIVQTCMISNDGWHWLITSWGHPEQLFAYHLSWFDIPILAALISATVQIFFAWRIWVLGRSYILTGLIFTLALMQGAASIGTGIKIRMAPDLAHISNLEAGPVWLGGSAAVDILIAVSMVYLLTKRKTHHESTEYLVSRLVRLTVETGSLTAAVAVVDLTMFKVFKDNNFHVAPAIVLAKLYSNTLLVVFNNRIYMRHGTRSTAVTGGTINNSTNGYNIQFRNALTRTGELTQNQNKTTSDTFMEDSEWVLPLTDVTTEGQKLNGRDEPAIVLARTGEHA